MQIVNFQYQQHHVDNLLDEMNRLQAVIDSLFEYGEVRCDGDECHWCGAGQVEGHLLDCPWLHIQATASEAVAAPKELISL